ncbi:MAG: hypothetical protein OJF49_004209 [Ktedonobacterales bacterium]|nr:MAG: hypothetical protein OJF49_004209 [Ktedonobacterales bacterium]
MAGEYVSYLADINIGDKRMTCRPSVLGLHPSDHRRGCVAHAACDADVSFHIADESGL